jgi:carbonic anhydrase
VARENVRRCVDDVAKRSAVLAALLEAGSIDVIGGMYDVATGEVEFF